MGTNGEQYSPSEMTEELLELASEGFLATESVVKEMRHAYIDLLDTILERKLSRLTLQITQNVILGVLTAFMQETKVLSNVHTPIRL